MNESNEVLSVPGTRGTPDVPAAPEQTASAGRFGGGRVARSRPVGPVGRMRAWAEPRGLDITPVFSFLVLVLVVVVVTIMEPAYLNTASIQSSLITAAPILLLSVGGALVVLTGGLDLSIGGTVGLSSVMLAHAFPKMSWVLAVLLVLVGAAVVGGFLGWLQAWAQIPSFITTLGALGILTGIGLKLSDGAPITVDSGYTLLDWLIGTTVGIPNTIVLVIVSLAVVAGLLRWTPIGRSVYAVGSAESAARISGIRSTRIRVFVFAVSAVMAALAGLCIMAPSASGAGTMGEGLLLPTIAAIVVGGTAISGGVGGVGRAVIGGLIISTVTSGMVVTGTDPGVQQVLFGAATVLAVALTTDRKHFGTVK